MKLKTYNANTIPNSQSNGSPTISLTKEGMISFSATLVTELNLKPGSKFSFQQDEERPTDWYLDLNDSPDAFTLKTRKGKSTLFLQHKALCNTILKSLNVPRNISLRTPVSIEPISKDHPKLYALITKNLKQL